MACRLLGWQATPSITKFLSSKSLSIFSVGENAREKDLAYFLRMEKLSEIKLPLKSYGQFYYFIWETYLPRDIRDVHWASKIVESNAVSGLIVAVAASEFFQLMKLFSRHEMEFPCVAMRSRTTDAQWGNHLHCTAKIQIPIPNL